MSHITKVEGFKFLNLPMMVQAGKAMGIEVKRGEAVLYRTEVKGIVVPLPRWEYPMVVDEKGEGSVDTFLTAKEDLPQLDVFKKRYLFECLQESATSRDLAFEFDQVDGELVMDEAGRMKVRIGVPEMAAAAEGGGEFSF